VIRFIRHILNTPRATSWGLSASCLGRAQLAGGDATTHGDTATGHFYSNTSAASPAGVSADDPSGMESPSGGPSALPFPTPRNHHEEIQNFLAEYRARKTSDALIRAQFEMECE